MTPADRLRGLVENDVVIAADDFERCDGLFRGLTTSRMMEQYGASGKTREKVLGEYRVALHEAREARDLLHRLLGPVRT